MSHGAFVIVGFIAAWAFAFWYDSENERDALEAKRPKLEERMCPRPEPLLAMRESP